MGILFINTGIRYEFDFKIIWYIFIKLRFFYYIDKMILWIWIYMCVLVCYLNLDIKSNRWILMKSFNIYKKSAAAQFTLLPPRSDENNRIQKTGAVLLEVAPSQGEKSYDWKNKKLTLSV